jgi:hypothetical protein
MHALEQALAPCSTPAPWRRRGTFLATALVLTDLAGLAACGARAADQSVSVAPPVEPERGAELPRRPLYTPGELMEFDLSFRGITMGNAVLAVGEPGTENGRPVVIVRSEVAGAGVVKMVKKVRDDVTTRIDLDTGAPIHNKGDLMFGDRQLVLESRFVGRHVIVDYTRKDTPPRRQLFVMPPDQPAHDAHSILGLLRAWEPGPGDTVAFHGLSGRRMWRNDLRFAGNETIRTARGLYPAIRLDGVATRLTSRLEPEPQPRQRTYTLWLSDDVNRVPLRVSGRTEFGDVAIELTRYYRPDRMVSKN